MPSEGRQIRIYIQPKDKTKKNVSITVLANFFQHLQKVLYQVCDEVSENEFRKTGRYPKSVKENCDLVLKKIKIASADVAVGLSYPQMGLPIKDFDKTFGERAISKTNDVFDIVMENDHIFPDLSPVISDELRRKRILTDIYKIWPESDSQYDCEIGVGKKELHQLNPDRKPKIKEAIAQTIIPSEKTVFGRLVEINVTKKHSCQIETPDGKYDCRYKSELEDLIRENTGHFISISGRMKNFHTILLESEKSLKPIHNIPIKLINIDGQLLELKKEINLAVDFYKKDSKYIVENKQINIFAINSDLNIAVDDIKGQIEMLWQGYVKEDISNLTESAIEFRNMLKKMIEG